MSYVSGGSCLWRVIVPGGAKDRKWKRQCAATAGILLVLVDVSVHWNPQNLRQLFDQMRGLDLLPLL